MIELTMVVLITGILATIAVPRFVDAGTGRKLNAAQRTLLDDVETIRLRAMATSETHLIKFYPADDSYIIFEGDTVERSAVVLTRDFAQSPFELSLVRTDLVDNYTVITPYGDVRPGFVVRFKLNGVRRDVAIAGMSETSLAVDASASFADVVPDAVKPVGEVVDALGVLP